VISLGKSLTYGELGALSTTARHAIVEKLGAATPAEWDHGMEWYSNAHARAQALHDDVQKGAEVIAVLSPQTQWPVNLRDAEKIISGDENVSAFKKNVVKAWRILEGETLDEVTQKGPKTKAFACNIQYPNGYCRHGNWCVTIDTHMMAIFELHISVIDRKGAYEALANGVRRAAYEFGILPHQAQAIAWLAQKERNRG